MRTLFILLSLTLIGCGGTAAPSSSGAANASPPGGGASASTPGSPSKSTAHAGGHPSSAPASTAACWPIQGGSAASVTMTGITSEADNGYDRFVIQFNSAVPSYQLKPNATGTQFSNGGQPVTVLGSFGVLLHLTNVTTPSQLRQNGDLQLQSSSLQEVRLLAGAAGTADFGVGLSKDVCPNISMMSGPQRLVIDFPT